MPALRDPNFDRSVVLLLAHGDEGALGVVLNRPSDATATEALPPWAPVASEPGVVFVGGPVAVGTAIGLGLAPREQSNTGWTRVLGPLGVVDLSIEPGNVGGGVEAVRLFTGYAGWSPGQLEGELAESAWAVVPAEVDDVFAPRPDTLWRDVLRRQPGRLGWLANFPADASVN